MSDLLQALFGNQCRPDFHALRECGSLHDSVEFGTACRPGVVYIVRFGDLYKIGATTAKMGKTSIRGRIKSANQQVGQDGEVVGYIETNCALGFERWLHKEFQSLRVHSEFFRLSETDIEALRAMTDFNGGPLVFHNAL